MSNIPALAAAVAVALPMLLAAPISASAATVGQPFFVVDGPDVTGSVLNLFSSSGPTEAYATRLSGTITQAFGATDLVGKPFSFFFEDTFPDPPTEFTIGGTSAFAEITAPFGILEFGFYLEPPFVEVPTGPDSTQYEYLGDFAGFPSRPGLPTGNLPGFEVALNLELTGPLPTRFYQEFDDMGNVVFETRYIEGPLPISRISVGTVGGDPLPPVPLPAGLPLLAFGLCAMGAAAYRRTV